jgi:LysM repeat protein
MLLMKRSAFFLAGLVLITTGCNVLIEPDLSSTLEIAPPQDPYQSTTRTPDQISPTPPLSTAEPLLPTATPFLHTIQAGETLYSIAIKYNISLDSLASANPGLDTRMLIVGSEVIIPFEEEEDLLATPTPYPISVGEPNCFPITDGGLWCYTLVENNQGIPLEDISLAFNLFDTSLELVMSQIAFPPLDILNSIQSLPVGTLIQDPPADLTQITTTLLSAYPSDQLEPGSQIEDYSVDFLQGNTVVEVNGFFEVTREGAQENQVWIVGVGYNEGKPVAVRKWISDEVLELGTAYPFKILLYSLGPEIDQIQIFSELH